jgi:hypothetical protein
VVALAIVEIVIARAPGYAAGVCRTNVAVSAIFALIVFPNVRPPAECQITFLRHLSVAMSLTSEYGAYG